MHIAVMDQPETAGHRHFSFGMTGRMVEMPRLIREMYGTRGLRPSTLLMPTWIIHLLKFFIRHIGALYGKLGHSNRYETKWPGVYSYRYTISAEASGTPSTA